MQTRSTRRTFPGARNSAAREGQPFSVRRYSPRHDPAIPTPDPTARDGDGGARRPRADRVRGQRSRRAFPHSAICSHQQLALRLACARPRRGRLAGRHPPLRRRAPAAAGLAAAAFRLRYRLVRDAVADRRHRRLPQRDSAPRRRDAGQLGLLPRPPQRRGGVTQHPTHRRRPRFRSGPGSCVIDQYRTSARSYREIACLVTGPHRATVIVGATTPGLWPREAPVIERAISAFVA